MGITEKPQRNRTVIMYPTVKIQKNRAKTRMQIMLRKQTVKHQKNLMDRLQTMQVRLKKLH